MVILKKMNNLVEFLIFELTAIAVGFSIGVIVMRGYYKKVINERIKRIKRKN